MIELLSIRVQYLNGSCVIRQHKLEGNKMFDSKEELEEYRKLRELKLQYKEDQRQHEVKVSVIFDYKEYANPS